ncbi:MAG: DnaA/Hda family protein, partial [Planctomycetota bacterium]
MGNAVRISAETDGKSGQRIEERVGVRVGERLERELGSTRYERYFERHTRLDFADGSLRVSVPSAFHADWLDRRFGRSVRAALSEEAGVQAHVRWSVDPDAFDAGVLESAPEPPHATDAPRPQGASDNAGRTPGQRTGRGAPPRSVLRGNAPARLRHSLDGFIVGPSSRLAHRVATQIAEADDAPISVLFLHGPCGVGKTHLLQGVAKRFTEARPWARVRYVSGEAFANQYIASVQAGNIDAFRERYRGVDLLCIDDVHFLRGKTKTQSEFLHTFEALDLEGARVVLASDGHPKRIEDLHEGIVSRCLSGMVVRLERPDRETRNEVVRTLFAKRGLVPEAGACEAIGESVTGSVRELEGAVKRVEAYARLL